MRAEQVPVEELAPLVGNYWRLVDDSVDEETVVIARAALPADVIAEGDALAALVAITEQPPPPPLPLTISKDAIWRRATDEEAEQMEAALQSQPVRIRRIYDGATFISTADELYVVLEGALVQMFGAERAAQLLEPTP